MPHFRSFNFLLPYLLLFTPNLVVWFHTFLLLYPILALVFHLKSAIIFLSCLSPTSIPHFVFTPVSCLKYFSLLLSHPISISISCFKSSSFLLSYSISIPVFYPESLTFSLLYLIPTLVSCLVSTLFYHSRFLNFLLPCLVTTPIFYLGFSALLLLCLMLGSGSLSLRKFKQSLSNKFWPYISTSSTFYYLFSTPDLDLNNNNKCKQIFDIVFINSHLLVSNHIIKQVDMSFVIYRYPAIIKLNRCWQLDLLDPKLVYIIKAIPLTIGLFWDLIFVLCPCHISKQGVKLSLRINRLNNGMVKERIETIWANKTISQLDKLFRDNLV